MQSIETMRQSMAQLPVPMLQHRDNPHEYIFFGLFDGTGQDANNPKLGLPTNVGELYAQAMAIAGDPDNRIGYGYSKGIGSQDNGLSRALDGALALTWDVGIEEMYREFAKQSMEWQRNDPQAQIRVAGVGYSRGAVQEAGFLRLVDQYGIANPKDLKFGRDEHGNITVESPHPPLVPPGKVVQVAALFDPVATNMPGNYDARLPPSVISSVSILAANEQRELFPHQTINAPGMTPDGRALNVPAPGGHSNIGGGNKEAGVEIMVGNAMVDYLNRLRDEPLFEKRPVPDDLTKMTVYQARGATAAFGLKMDDDGVRNLREELANCKIVDPCRNSEPMSRELANQFEYRTGSVDPAEQAQLRALVVQALDPERDALQANSDHTIQQQQWQREQQQQQLQQLQREEQRHTAGIQAAAEQQATARTALDSGLLLTDPDHPAHEHYEQARQGVVQVYSHQKKELDDRVEPMAASLVAQAQREGLSNINAVTLSADGQHLVASNTRDATAAHREMVQVPAAQAAHQSVADSSRQWAEQRIAQAQIQVHTQARTQVQERAQTYTPTLERAPARTPPHEPDRQTEAQMATANIQARMQQSQHQSQQAVQQVLLQQNAVRGREEERLEKHRQDAQPGALPGRATDDVSTASEHWRDHRMAPSAGQFPSQPERAPIAQTDAHPEMNAGVEKKPLSHAPAQAEDRAAYVTPIQRGRSADEDAKEQQPEPRREAGHRRDPGESAPSMNHAAAVALASGKDPRHPNHPDHALHQQIQDKTEALCESKGIPLAGDQLDRVAASLTAEAKRVKISSADHVLFSERPGTQEIGENLIVVQGALDKPGIRYGVVVAHEAVQTPIAASFDKLEQVNQTQAMQQQQLAQEQQQEQSRSAQRMVM